LLANLTIAGAGTLALVKKIKTLKTVVTAVASVKSAGSFLGVLAAGAGLWIGGIITAGLAGLWKIGDAMVADAHKAALFRESLKPIPEEIKKVIGESKDWIDIQEKMGSIKTVEDVLALRLAIKKFERN